MVNLLVVVGIIAIIAGLPILIAPSLTTPIIAALLIAGGAIAIVVGSGRTRIA